MSSSLPAPCWQQGICTSGPSCCDDSENIHNNPRLDIVTDRGSSTVDQTVNKLTTGYDARGLVVSAGSEDAAGDLLNAVYFDHIGWRQLFTEAQVLTEDWRMRYSRLHPHSGLVMQFPGTSSPHPVPSITPLKKPKSKLKSPTKQDSHNRWINFRGYFRIDFNPNSL